LQADYEKCEEIIESPKVTITRGIVEMPYFFYSEQDMHAHLCHEIISGKLGEFLMETNFGDKSVLVHTAT